MKYVVCEIMQGPLTFYSCHALLPDALTVKNASALMLSFSCREIHRSCKVLIPSILRSHSGRCLSAATNSTSLSTTIGRSQHPFSIVGEAVKS